jgi:hypothetical protein
MLERVYEGTIVTYWDLLLLTMERHVLGSLGITVSSYRLQTLCDIDHMASINIIVTRKRRLIARSRVNKYSDQRVESLEYLLSHLGLSSYHEAKGYNKSANTIRFVCINIYLSNASEAIWKLVQSLCWLLNRSSS